MDLDIPLTSWGTFVYGRHSPHHYGSAWVQFPGHRGDVSLFFYRYRLWQLFKQFCFRCSHGSCMVQRLGFVFPDRSAYQGSLGKSTQCDDIVYNLSETANHHTCCSLNQFALSQHAGVMTYHAFRFSVSLTLVMFKCNTLAVHVQLWNACYVTVSVWALR